MNLKESLLHKSGMDLYVRKTYLEEQCSQLFNEKKTLVEKYISEVNEDDKSTIIELRNEPVLCELANVEQFVSEQLQSLGNAVFAKKVTLEEACNNIFKLNTVLGTNYDINDFYKNAKSYLTEDDNITIEYESVDISLLNKYKNKLELCATKCNECLFNDLYNVETLNEELPILLLCNSL